MAQVGRKKLLDPGVKWTLQIPESITARVDLLLCDPLLGKPMYGARSDYIATLLRRDLESPIPMIHQFMKGTIEDEPR
jgi:hypothetical protein